MVASGLVLLMVPALALFYGGLVRTKNVLSTFMHCFGALAIVSVQWVVCGYTLAFGPTQGGMIGGLDHLFLRGVGTDPLANQTIPHLAFCALQMMFAAITPALIAGAFAERLKFSTFAVFTLAWTTLVYDPLCHWVWAPGGWLGARGALDFAGGTVIHLSSGISALVFAIVLGPRLGYPKHKVLPHNLPMTLLGSGILWFGWFGFNAGSALSAGGIAARALVNTHVAAAAGALAWAGAEWIRHKKPSALGVASGMIAGLVAITPAAGFVGTVEALVIGLIAGPVCFGAVLLKPRFGYDDALDAFGVHGVGGAVGALLTGVLAHTIYNPAGANGLLYGESHLFVENLLSLAVAVVYGGAVSFVLIKILEKTMGLRPDPESEYDGLDTSLHGEQAYGTSAGVSADTSRVTASRMSHEEDEAMSPLRTSNAGTS